MQRPSRSCSSGRTIGRPRPDTADGVVPIRSSRKRSIAAATLRSTWRPPCTRSARRASSASLQALWPTSSRAAQSRSPDGSIRPSTYASRGPTLLRRGPVFFVSLKPLDCDSRVPFPGSFLINHFYLTTVHGSRTLPGRWDAGTLLYITTSGPRFFCQFETA